MDRIAPLAQVLAEANGIDWQRIKGSGAGGQIVEQDILNYLSRVMSGEEDPPDTPVDLPPPDWNGEEVPTAAMLNQAGMNADMLSRAGVDTDLTAFVEQTRTGSPEVPATPAPSNLDEDTEFELDDEPETAPEPVAAAPVPQPTVPQPTVPQPTVAQPPVFQPEVVTPAPAAPTPAPMPEPVMPAAAMPEPAPAPVTPPPAAPAAPAGGLSSLLSRLYQKPAQPEAAAPAPTPAPMHEPVAAQPVVTPPVVAEPAPVAPTPVMPEPVTPVPMPEPVAAQAEPVFTQPEPVFTQPEPTPEPVAAQPVATEPEPVVAEPVAAQPEPVFQPEPTPTPLPTPAPVATPAPMPAQTPAPAGGVWFGTYMRRSADVAALHDLRGQVSRALSSELPLGLLVARAAQRHAGALGVSSVGLDGQGRTHTVGSGSLRDAVQALDTDFDGTPDLLVVDAAALDLDDLHYPHTVTLSVGRAEGGRATLSLNGDVDTARAAQFLAQVAGTLEQPILLVL